LKENNELEKDVERSGHGLIFLKGQHKSGRTFVRIICVPAGSNLSLRFFKYLPVEKCSK
jgi:hypothetical protein